MSGMSEYGRDFQRWLIGELRTDGRKSPWLIEQEAIREALGICPVCGKEQCRGCKRGGGKWA